MKKASIKFPLYSSGLWHKVVLNLTIYFVYRKIKCFLLRTFFRKNAYDKNFDWNWRIINFNRIALVNLLIQIFPNCEYLEIGCASNQLFNSVPLRNKTGVDPNVGGNVRLTSDAFFKQNQSSYDVVFIDGLHTYEQVRKDVLNAIEILKPGGYIALHDMLPRDWTEEHIPVLSSGVWTGDVWKVAFELTRTVGIDFKLITIDYGVGIFKIVGNDPELNDSRVELADKNFAYLYENIDELSLIEWDEFLIWVNNSNDNPPPTFTG